jgi:hypothetical protein
MCYSVPVLPTLPLHQVLSLLHMCEEEQETENSSLSKIIWKLMQFFSPSPGSIWESLLSPCDVSSVWCAIHCYQCREVQWARQPDSKKGSYCYGAVPASHEVSSASLCCFKIHKTSYDPSLARLLGLLHAACSIIATQVYVVPLLYVTIWLSWN